MIDPRSEPDRLFTVKEVALFFSVQPRTILSWIEWGWIDAHRPGHKYLIRGDAILETVKRSKFTVF